MTGFENLGTLLKEERMNRGYTQAALAQALKNVHSQFVSNWERGLCAPPSHCFQDLIEVLRINRKKIEDAMLRDAREEIRERLYKKKSKAA